MRLSKCFVLMSSAFVLCASVAPTVDFGSSSVYAQSADSSPVHQAIGIEMLDGGYLRVMMAVEGGDPYWIIGRLSDVYVPEDQVANYTAFVRELLSSTQTVSVEASLFEDGDHIVRLVVGNHDVSELVLEKGFGMVRLEPGTTLDRSEVLSYVENIARENAVGVWASDLIEVPAPPAYKLPKLNISFTYESGTGERQSMVLNYDGSTAEIPGVASALPNVSAGLNNRITLDRQNGSSSSVVTPSVTGPSIASANNATVSPGQNGGTLESLPTTSSSSEAISSSVDESSSNATSTESSGVEISDAPKPSGSNVVEHKDETTGLVWYEVQPDPSVIQAAQSKREYYGETAAGQVVYRKTTDNGQSTYHTLDGRQLSTDEVLAVKKAEVAQPTITQQPSVPVQSLQVTKVATPTPKDARHAAGIEYCDAMALRGFVNIPKTDVSYHEMADANGNGIACELGGEESSYAEVKNGVIMYAKPVEQQQLTALNGQSTNATNGLQPLGAAGNLGLQPLNGSTEGLQPLGGASTEGLQPLGGTTATTATAGLQPLDQSTQGAINLPATGEVNFVSWIIGLAGLAVSLLGFAWLRSNHKHEN